MNLRSFLNKLIWDNNPKYRLEDYDIVYIHRGAPNNLLRINGSEITRIYSDSFEYYDKNLDEKKRIPFHRIEQIINYVKKETIYQKTVRS